MAITNLSTQHISASYKYLAQISSSGDIYDGLGNQITSLNLVTSSYVTAQTASHALFAKTASYLNTLNQNVTLNGNLTINGTGSFTYISTTYESASIIFSSGSNQLGDATNDIQTLVGSVLVSGSLIVTGSTILSGSTTLLGTKTITGSVFITGSKTIIGTNTITGSLLVSGSQNFIGTKTLSGSIFITGSKTIIGNNFITGSHNVSGSMTLTGPSIQNAATLIDPLISGSMEFDGTTFYRTVDASGRSLNANHHLFYLPTSITHTTNFGTLVDVFSGSLHAFTMQPNSLYEVQYNIFYTHVGTGGNLAWQIDGGNQSWQNANIQIERTGLAGGTSATTGSAAVNSTSNAGLAPVYTTHINALNQQNIQLYTGTNTTNTNHKAIIKALIYSNAGTSSVLRLRHLYTAGTGTIIWAGSYYTIKKMPAASVGVFTAPAVAVGL